MNVASWRRSFSLSGGSATGLSATDAHWPLPVMQIVVRQNLPIAANRSRPRQNAHPVAGRKQLTLRHASGTVKLRARGVQNGEYRWKKAELVSDGRFVRRDGPSGKRLTLFRAGESGCLAGDAISAGDATSGDATFADAGS